MLSGGDRVLINTFQMLLSLAYLIFMDFSRFQGVIKWPTCLHLVYALCKTESLTKTLTITSTVFLLVFETFIIAENSFMYRMIQHIITLIRVYLNLRGAQLFS